MSVYQGRDFKKPSGGLVKAHRRRRKHELGRRPTETMRGDREERVSERVRGGGLKIRLRKAAYASVANVETGKVQKVKILKVRENKANADYSRRGVITKGAIIETELGLAKVTSRPGQEGAVNAIIIRPEKTSR